MRKVFHSVFVTAVLVLSMVLMAVPAYADTPGARCAPIPDAPTGLTATVNGDNSITFSWSAVAGVEKYAGEWGTDSTFAKKYKFAVEPPTTSFTTKPGLSPGTYYFRVKAGDFEGRGHPPTKWSRWSSPVSATINETPNPEELSIIAPDDIIVEGNATGGATGVDLGAATASGGTPPYTITNDAPGLFPLGDTVVTWTVTDSNGDVASDTQTVTIVDTTPPTITVVSSLTVIVGAPSSVLPPPTVSDIVDPSPTVANDAPSIFPLGTTLVTWTATDASGNSSTATTTVTAVYDFKGFLPPLVVDGVAAGHFKAGSTIPVKFQLTDYNGNPVTTATGTASINTTPMASANLLYNDTDMQYIANLKIPKTAAPGSYTITVALNDGTSHQTSVTINDAAGIIVNPTGGLVTTEDSGTANFTLVLNAQPTDDVSINLSTSDDTEGTVSPLSLTFTTANWNTPQQATITGQDDTEVDGNVDYTIVTAAATSADPDYNGLDADDVSVTNNDNDALTFKLDNQIRKPGKGSYIGDNVYNNTGAGQFVTQTVRRNVTVTYPIKIENDGNTSDSFIVTGTAEGDGWTVTYYDTLKGGTNITTQVTSGGGWLTGSLAPGAFIEIRVQVTPGSTVIPGSVKNVLVTSTSNGDGSKKDVVKAATRAVVILLGSNIDAYGTVNIPENNLVLTRFKAIKSGNVIQIQIYSLAAGKVKVAIYADNEGNPGALLEAKNTATAVGAGKWNKITFPSTAVTAGTWYWLGVATNAAGAASHFGTVGQSRTKSITKFGTFAFSDPAGTDLDSQSWKTSIGGWGTVP